MLLESHQQNYQELRVTVFVRASYYEYVKNNKIKITGEYFLLKYFDMHGVLSRDPVFSTGPMPGPDHQPTLAQSRARYPSDRPLTSSGNPPSGGLLGDRPSSSPHQYSQTNSSSSQSPTSQNSTSGVNNSPANHRQSSYSSSPRNTPGEDVFYDQQNKSFDSDSGNLSQQSNSFNSSRSQGSYQGGSSSSYGSQNNDEYGAFGRSRSDYSSSSDSSNYGKRPLIERPRGRGGGDRGRGGGRGQPRGRGMGMPRGGRGMSQKRSYDDGPGQGNGYDDSSRGRGGMRGGRGRGRGTPRGRGSMRGSSKS